MEAIYLILSSVNENKISPMANCKQIKPSQSNPCLHIYIYIYWYQPCKLLYSDSLSSLFVGECIVFTDDLNGLIGEKAGSNRCHSVKTLEYVMKLSRLSLILRTLTTLYLSVHSLLNSALYTTLCI